MQVSNENTYKTFDMGFPVALQPETTITVDGPAHEHRTYAITCNQNGTCTHEEEGDAIVVRWKLSKPAMGAYIINAWCGSFWDIFKCLKGDEEKIKYEMLRFGSDPGEMFNKLIKTALAFDTIEMVLFDGDKYPRLVLRSDKYGSQNTTWQQLKDKKMCVSRNGFYAENGWCRFEKLETMVNKQLQNYIKSRPKLAKKYEEVGNEQDSNQKLELMKDIITTLLNTPYKTKESCTQYNCWTNQNIIEMANSAKKFLKLLHQFYLRSKQ